MERNHRWLFWLTALLVLFLFVAAFALSYDNLYNLALDNGINPRLVWLWPLGLDAFMAASSLAVLWASLNQTRVMWLRGLVIMSVLASIAGNVLHADGSLLAQTVAGLPPTVAFLSFEVLMVMVRHETTRAGLRSTLAELQASVNQLRAETEQERTTLRAIQERARSARERVAGLEVQQHELQQSIGELERAGGDPVTVRRERLRAMLQGHNGDRPPHSELAAALGVSLSTLKRDLEAIE